MLFNWVRQTVKNAVLSGVNDAIAELTGATGKEPEVPQVILSLPYRAEPEKAASPQIEEPTRNRRKGN